MHLMPFLYNFDLPNQVRYNLQCLADNPNQVTFKSIMVENHKTGIWVLSGSPQNKNTQYLIKSLILTIWVLI